MVSFELEFAVKAEIAAEFMHPGTRLLQWVNGGGEDKGKLQLAIETITPINGKRNAYVFPALTPENADEILANIPVRSKEVFEYKE